MLKQLGLDGNKAWKLATVKDEDVKEQADEADDMDAQPKTKPPEKPKIKPTTTTPTPKQPPSTNPTPTSSSHDPAVTQAEIDEAKAQATKFETVKSLTPKILPTKCLVAYDELWQEALASTKDKDLPFSPTETTKILPSEHAVLLVLKYGEQLLANEVKVFTEGLWTYLIWFAFTLPLPRPSRQKSR